MLFRRVNYFVERPNCPVKAKIMVVADVHFDYVDVAYDNELWRAMLRMARAEEPGAILIPGDLVDSLEFIGSSKRENLFIRRLSALTKIAPVFIDIGNHDQCIYDDTEGMLMAAPLKCFDDFLKLIERTSARVLNNEAYLDVMTGINFIGVTLPTPYYSLCGYEYNGEERPEVLEMMLRHNKSILTGAPGRFNIAMMHSARYLNESMTREFMPEVDMTVSGHMHNGCVPIGLYELTDWSSWGLVSPAKAPFIKNCRNTARKTDGKVVTVGALKTLNELKALNGLFPPEVSFIHLEKTAEEGRPIRVEKKYVRVSGRR